MEPKIENGKKSAKNNKELTENNESFTNGNNRCLTYQHNIINNFTTFVKKSERMILIIDILNISQFFLKFPTQCDYPEFLLHITS